MGKTRILNRKNRICQEELCFYLFRFNGVMVLSAGREQMLRFRPIEHGPPPWNHVKFGRWRPPPDFKVLSASNINRPLRYTCSIMATLLLSTLRFITQARRCLGPFPPFIHCEGHFKTCLFLCYQGAQEELPSKTDLLKYNDNYASEGRRRRSFPSSGHSLC